MGFQIKVVAIYKKDVFFELEIQRYLSLILHYADLEIIRINSFYSSNRTTKEILEGERKSVLSKIPKNSYCVALSEDGKIPKGSINFAKWLNKFRSFTSPVVFIIGGAYGLSEDLKKSCAEVLSLSPLTFQHKLCLVILLEQIYRALTIINNHPYHK